IWTRPISPKRRRSSTCCRRLTTGCTRVSFSRRTRAMHDLPHDHTHPHVHDEPEGPGVFHERGEPLARDYRSRAFTIGIGGPAGRGKTALLLALCRMLRGDYQLAVVTNDIFTKEDGEFLVRHDALPPERITAVETGGCPHTAVRDDVSRNLDALGQLMTKFHPHLL